MCTVTFFPFSSHQYILAANRDELRTRARALLPERHTEKDIAYSYPIDGDKGGTWIATNRYGLSLCIMNWFQAYDPTKDYTNFTSRGKIIPMLISSADIQECEHRLNLMSLEHFQPFRLLGINADPLHILQWKWDGLVLQRENHPVTPHIWVSAGLEYDKVLRNRQSVFQTFLKQDGTITVDRVKKLHASEDPEKSIYSIAMWHERAATVSTTIIDVHNGSSMMYYLDGYPASVDKWISVNI